MKTETYPEEANLTAGQILRQAREKLELSQQTVADRLCLKVSTVRDIEEDNVPANIVPTFFRGYIRAYAKLVQVPESELLTKLDAQMPNKAVKTSPMQSFSAQKIRKKRDGWLMKVTWFVIIILLGMTGMWWWQNYKAQQKELASMTEQTEAQLQAGNALSSTNSAPASAPSSTGKNTLVPANNAATNSNVPSSSSASAPVATESKIVPLPGNQPAVNNVSSNTVSDNMTSGNTVATNNVASTKQGISTNQGIEHAASATGTISNSVASSPSTDMSRVSAVNSNELVINFTGECWLDIKDAKGKKLFSGTKNRGDSLKLSGTLPYSLHIGAPAQVNIEFQGNHVNLDEFIKKGSAARLTLP
ncbi:cytoskeleton protein RodZ [Xenorhabdus sp. Flor]|uniref:cytoskeleton protein RodZ n=1 Tax=Xenorhabdus cabanillasii TaxID=351673 RepID=UPI0019BAEDA1|nr:cytoskeleton protein RodZ [Xenorhabdus sp. Flor]MBD2815163.1 cytoskeleton protein RodZ [Xenorhabdus sp. Flor]